MDGVYLDEFNLAARKNTIAELNRLWLYGIDIDARRDPTRFDAI